jgi:nucleoside-diphosphate-sugar epimerase
MTSFWRCYGLETVCLRYFNVFGPRQDPHSPYSGVLAKFITQMLAGEQPVIFGDGKHSRDFTYIENVVQANLLACTAPVKDVAGRVLQYRQRAANRTERNVLGLAETHGIVCSSQI